MEAHHCVQVTSHKGRISYASLTCWRNENIGLPEKIYRLWNISSWSLKQIKYDNEIVFAVPTREFLELTTTDESS